MDTIFIIIIVLFVLMFMSCNNTENFVDATSVSLTYPLTNDNLKASIVSMIKAMYDADSNLLSGMNTLKLLSGANGNAIKLNADICTTGKIYLGGIVSGNLNSWSLDNSRNMWWECGRDNWINFSSTNNNRFSIGPNASYFTGNVGIGTDNPQSKLHISNRLNQTADNGTPQSTYISFSNNNYISSQIVVSDYVFNGKKCGDLSIYACKDTPFEVLRINSNGNVGIGTNSPQFRLDVQGDTRIGRLNNAATLIINNQSSLISFKNHILGTTPGYLPSPGIVVESQSQYNDDGSPGRLYLGMCAYNGSGGGAYGIIQATYTNLKDRKDITNTLLLLNPKGGNVGIGTDYPLGSLHVVGSILGDNVGIGTNKPRAPLHVVGSVKGNEIFGDDRKRYYSYFYNFGGIDDIDKSKAWNDYNFGISNQLAGGISIAPSTQDISIYASKYIWATGFIASSDKRIKTNIENADTSTVLTKILQLPLMIYNYIDIIKEGNHKTYGMIAQQVAEIFPEASGLQTESIPSIYKNATAVVLSDNELNIILTVNISNTSELKVGGNVELIIEDMNDKYEAVVISFTSTQLVVPKWDNFDSTKKVFVYGVKINDFHTIDKPYLGVVCMGGIQELSKQITLLQQQVAMLMKKL